MSVLESKNLVGDEGSFEKQFSLVENYKVAGGMAEVVDIHPDTPKSTVPVLIAPAWACTTETYKPAIGTLVGLGRRVVAFNHPRRGDNMSTTQRPTGKNYPTEQLRKALNIIGIMEQKGIKKTDVIAHSEGAVNTVIAATLYPQKFRDIVLFGPAGLIGKDTFIRLLSGFSSQVKRPESLLETSGNDKVIGYKDIPVTETEKWVTTTSLKEAVKYFAANPVRAIREGIDLANSQIHEMLYELHDKGIGIVVISSIDDPAFPMERMQQIVKTGMLDGFLCVRGGHGQLGSHPELYVGAAEGMLAALEAKREKGTTSLKDYI